MNETEHKGDQSSAQADQRSEVEVPRRRPYVAPQVLSAEPLEAAASTCDPPNPTSGVGKGTPPCTAGRIGS